jgi:uncharacterized protein (TIGR00299 family) protein
VAALLLLEPIGGLAGDMFLAAALDAGVAQAALEAQLATLGLPGWRLEATRTTVSGIAATHVEVRVDQPGPASRRLRDIVALVRGSGLAPRAREAALDLFARIGRAEARVHGVPVEEVHFHEVGAVDSVVDVCGAAVVLDLLGWPRALSAPPELGRGLALTAHGPVPVPPPAVLELLAGVEVRPGGPPGEAVTPTGAAILAGLFEVGPLPPHRPGRIGYGAGTVRWPDRPNLVRLTLAEPAGQAGAGGLVVLEANLDDCPGELVARAIEAALEAGALDAWAAPLTMKKGRPGLLVGALSDEVHRVAVTEVLFRETTTLGVRAHAVAREELRREVVAVATPHGEVRVKLSYLGGRVVGAHPEYEDCAARARAGGVAVRAVMAAALAAWRGGGGGGW